MSDRENLLERSLRLATTDAAFRPEFYSTLLNSEILILGHKDPHPDEKIVDLVARPGSQIHIQDAKCTDGSVVIPFFSSLNALRLYQDQTAPYLIMDAKGFFDLTGGQDLFLNPASDYARRFTASDIEGLLSNGLPTQQAREVLPMQTQILLGIPETPPTEVMDILSRYFKKDPRVVAAYVALMQVEDKEPELCIGIECDPALYEDIGAAAAATISHTLGDERSIVFVPVDPANPASVASYMLKEVTPFFHGPAKVVPSKSMTQALQEKRPRTASPFGKRRR